MTDLTIRGSKGGESAHSPVESPDSLINTSYAHILDAISEGPIVGLVNGAQSIYLDQTPLQNADGSYNFTGVTWEQRTGEHDQDHISGFPAVESEHAVGVELKASQPWTQAFSNLELSAVRVRLGVQSLFEQNEDGDTGGYSVAYVIELATDGSDYQTILEGAFTGKQTSSGYQRSHRIDLPTAEQGWSLRVRRTTPESTSARVGDATSIVGYAEVIDAKLQYPYTALVGMKIDASQFSSTPERAFRVRLRIVQVPSNYDPATRSYSGVWNGTFKLAWTDNPAWIYRDLILNDRYGLGRFISAAQVDKWALYQIAQYADQLVDDGKGGKEPRFTCNLYLQARASALQVLQDIASIFRGMSYYAGSEVICSADMPSDPVYTYTNSNVIDGMFNRPGSSGSTRFSVCKVAWVDRENFGAQRVEYVQLPEAVRRYGIRETDLTAFGCVSQGQAQRLGLYHLMTNFLETGTIQFSVGLDGVMARPGQIIRVADQNYVGQPIGGRIRASSIQSVTIDDDVTVTAGDTLVIIQPNGVAQTRVVAAVAGRVITVAEDFDAAPIVDSVYTVETAEVVAETYRILSVVEAFGDDKLQYDIVAVQHNASKFAAIDTGAQIVTPPTTVLPNAAQAMPTDVALETFDSVRQGINVATMRVTWKASPGAQSYHVWWRRNSGDWIYAGVTYTTAIEVQGIYTGTYTARVSAIGVTGNASLWAYSQPTELYGKTGEPPALASLTATPGAWKITLDWAFPPGAEDSAHTELQRASTVDGGDASTLGLLAYPTNNYTLSGLAGGASAFFRGRLVDRIGGTGPWTEWVHGQASADTGEYLGLITEDIVKSALGEQMLSDIELITSDGPGSVNDRINDARNALNEQIAEVDQAVAAVKSNLQEQIDNIADLADSMPYKPGQAYTADQGVLGDDGRLYQAKGDVPAGNPPPNSTYWTDVGQAVRTANGLAARVGTVETTVTELDGEIDAQAHQIDGLRTSIAGKADASVVNGLSSRVTQNEQGLTSQGQAITGLNGSLATTNQNVTAAQQAAQAASDTAGSKGKVLFQSAAPAAADRQTQNLWIDTTGNANTPKRWNGNAWVPATDKVATDAAAAAASALAQVATKAEASVVQALTNTVSQQGDAVTAQGQALTNINTSLESLGGENFLFNPSFDVAGAASALIADGFSIAASEGVVFSSSLPASSLDPAGKAQRVEASNLAALSVVDLSQIKRSPASEGQVFTASVSVRGSVGLGLQIVVQFRNAATTLIGEARSGNLAVSAAWTRFNVTTQAAPAGTTQVNIYLRTRQGPSNPVAAGFMEYDRAQLELGRLASGWRDNNTLTDAAVTSNAAATTLLTGRVAQTESGLTSVSGQVVQLSNNIGSMGGDNLLANSSFEDLPAGVTDRPKFWRAGGTAPVLTFVDSPLSSSSKAVRLSRAGLANGTYIDLSWNPTDGERPRVMAGVSYVLSVYARLSSPSARLAMYVQWTDESGVVQSTTQLAETQAGTSFTRYSFVATCPAGATRANIYAGRLLNRSGVAADMWIELDNVQFQEGSLLTAYSPSVQGVASEQAATSAAVSGLQSSVTQQGQLLSSVSGRTTTLENAVNSTATGLATRASASALEAVSNRVTAAEGVNTSQSSSIVNLTNSVGAIQSALGASGLDPAPDAVWNFDTSVEAWVAEGATISHANGSLVVTATTNDPRLVRGGYTFSGSLYPLVRAKITRKAGTATDWDGSLFYQTAAHGWSGSYFKRLANPSLVVGQSVILEWDMAALTAGGTDWLDSNIIGLRLDLGNTSGGVFEVDWIAVGRAAPGASSRALSSLDSKVVQQGDKITAESQRIDGLFTSVAGVNTAVQSEATARSEADTALGKRVDTVQTSIGQTNASVQTISTAQTALNGKVNASWQVKLQVNSKGQYVFAGVGLGVENGPAGLQSQFLVMADRFAVLNSINGSLFSPFAIQGGQVIIDSAMIGNGTIDNAKIGDVLYSSNYVPQQSGWVLRKDGGFEINSTIPGAGRILLNGNGLNVYDQNGVLRVQLGNLG